MKFINRTMEFELLKQCSNFSQKKLYTVVIYGLRRVGKTRLILEFIKTDGLYFYVTKNKSSSSLLEEFEQTLRIKKYLTEFEKINNWDSFFTILFTRVKGIIVFDEFQQFYDIDMSIYGLLQKYIDLYENEKNILLIFLGSLIGLIKKTFRDQKEPLYGRVKRELFLKQLKFSESIEFCKELKITDPNDIISLYSIFGGFPRYYIAIEDEGLEGNRIDKIMDKFFLNKNALFENEVEMILSLEFGKRRGRYYDILAAIAAGNTKLSKISNYLKIKETQLTRYISELTNFFELICQEEQVIGNKKLFAINNPLINFWFKFFYKNSSLYHIREKKFIEMVKKEVNSYVGMRFETICKEFLINKQLFNFEKIGKQWGKYSGESGKNTYEIDICAINNLNKEILFAECKWKENINASKIADDLQFKASFVDWNANNRVEYYAIFAKSFNKKISSYNGKKVFCYDINDLICQEPLVK